MDQKTIDLIKHSWTIIDDRSDDLIMVYEKLWQWAPDTRSIFSIDISRQAKKLKDSLAFVVNHVEDEEQLLQSSKELGRGHSQYAISDNHYEKLNRAFVESIEEIMGDDYKEEIGQAWDEALTYIGEIMIKSKG